ncbi:MAG: hypothetical protein R2730_02405 [Chitinophagales bacterium]
MSNRLKHGERNKKLSEDLLSGKVYLDWVVTTAFYAAIHFVEDKILPCTINSKKCNNIAEVRSAYKSKGKHAAREKLVIENLPNIAVQYKWLDDKSRYARYTTFKVTSSEAAKANQYLNEICKCCI